MSYYVPFRNKMLNRQAKEDHLKNVQNSEIAGQQPNFLAMYNNELNP